jgi:hypothetical protein
MYRFSIRALMSIIVLAAIGLAGIRDPNGRSSAPLLSLALAAVWINLVGAFRATERARCAGYVVVSGGYLLLALNPILTTCLPTTRVLNYLFLRSLGFPASITEERLLEYSRAMDQWDRLQAAGRGPGDQEFDALDNALANLPNPHQRLEEQASFVRAGHCLFALMVGLVGGTLAARSRARLRRLRTVLNFARWPSRRPQNVAGGTAVPQRWSK